jgi:xylan 1,4-beta-xylosidase
MGVDRREFAAAAAGRLRWQTWWFGLAVLVTRFPSSPAAAGADRVGERVTIAVRADRTVGPVQPFWQFFGYDEANYTYAPDGRKLLQEIAALGPRPAHIRTHHLLTSGDGTPWLKWSSSGAYREDAEGRPRYDWTILDRIFDTFRDAGVKPFVEIGFMPQALSVKPEPYQNPVVTHGVPQDAVGRGWACPPKDYARWEKLVEAWARHCAERYGQAEAESWYWELWNEPNIAYWRGTPAEFHRLYDHTAAAVKRVLPRAPIGGPHVAGTIGPGAEGFLRQFLEHCLRGANAVTGRAGTPLDFVAFHAKGGTSLAGGHVRMNLGNHLRIVDHGFEIVASYPELCKTPIILGESDPDGCAACSARFFPENEYRNGAQYASYTVATFLRKLDLAERRGVTLQGALTWAFTFPDQPWFDGFRELATRGVAKPVLNAFRMFSRLEPGRVAVENASGRSLDDLMKSSVRGRPDVDAFATRGDRALAVLVWHYHDDGAPGPEATVDLSLAGLPAQAATAVLKHFRIDDEHSNAHAAWLKMGSPQEPSPAQYAELQRASELTLLEPARAIEARQGSLSLRLRLPRQAVSLIRLEW